MNKRNYNKLKIKTAVVLLIFLFLPLVLGYLWNPYDLTAMDLTAKLSLPSSVHLLGTDNFGRDILSRLFVGVAYSLGLGFLTLAIGGSLGLIIGAYSGYFGGRIDRMLQKIVELQMALPGILWALVILALTGDGLNNLLLALSIMIMPRFTRISRSGFMKYRNYSFVKLAKTHNYSNFRIMFAHILPNLWNDILVTSTLSLAITIMSESGLSYLGFGIQPPHPSIGKMLSEAQVYAFTNPFYVVVVAVFLSLLVIALTTLGEGIQESYEQQHY